MGCLEWGLVGESEWLWCVTLNSVSGPRPLSFPNLICLLADSWWAAFSPVTWHHDKLPCHRSRNMDPRDPGPKPLILWATIDLSSFKSFFPDILSQQWTSWRVWNFCWILLELLRPSNYSLPTTSVVWCHVHVELIPKPFFFLSFWVISLSFIELIFLDY
jgi:hypothetical protein